MSSIISDSIFLGSFLSFSLFFSLSLSHYFIYLFIENIYFCVHFEDGVTASSGLPAFRGPSPLLNWKENWEKMSRTG